MNKNNIKDILERISSGEISVDEALEKLGDFPSALMDFAHIDTHRFLRRGIPETVFGEGKTPEQIEQIVERMLSTESPVLITRISPVAAEGLAGRFPDADYDPVSSTVLVGRLPSAGGRSILVMAAGTSDLPVAEEACRTAAFLGRDVVRAYDVGVAGIHRLASYRNEMAGSGVIIAVAGMEGALPGVIAGLVSKPVIGVPTSIGYGASFSGITPLLTMLSSCAGGLTVVNIDNGYGAAVAAHLMLGGSEGKSSGE
jgi:NCAIR mutase (PurE)-related protein